MNVYDHGNDLHDTYVVYMTEHRINSLGLVLLQGKNVVVNTDDLVPG